MSDGGSFNEALALHQGGQPAKAERIYRQILQRQPDHLGALHLLGVIHHQRGEHLAAIEMIGRAIAVNPRKAVYHSNYGAALLSLERLQEAVQSFERALNIWPECADALANLGMAQSALGQDEAATATLRKALATQPRHADALKRLATLLARLGREDEAIELYEQAIAKGASQQTWVNFGSLLLTIRRPRLASERRIVRCCSQPDHAVAHFNLGSAYEELNLPEEARQHFDRASGLCPGKPLWRLRAAMCGPAP